MTILPTNTDSFMIDVLAKMKELRAEAVKRDITFVVFELEQTHDGRETVWTVYTAANNKSSGHVKAPKIDDAFEEACRRVCWERDIAMKQLPPSSTTADNDDTIF